ncbi:hypothetical protein G7046_g7768 [Stylonectria norvegica]|nr:hypothetical protein G7046_g7768 [Stylonectria norvegica]
MADKPDHSIDDSNDGLSDSDENEVLQNDAEENDEFEERTQDVKAKGKKGRKGRKGRKSHRIEQEVPLGDTIGTVDVLVKASAVQLHSVYSGRGDAFYITWKDTDTNLHMVMVDAGPYNYSPTKYSTSAPYWRYLAHAGRRIWATNSDKPFKLDLIINTHPHDDHIGGLMALIQHDLTPFLGCPIVIPAFYSSETQLDPIQEHLVNRHWKPTLLNAYDAQGAAFPPAGILLKYPSSAQMLVFQPPSGLAVDTENVANSATTKKMFNLVGDLNHASILVKTSFDNIGPSNEIQSNMFITGDNTGSKITPFVKGKKFAIYKIQHHGSRFECLGEDIRNIPQPVKAEALVLFTLLYKHRESYKTKLPLYFSDLIPKDPATGPSLPSATTMTPAKAAPQEAHDGLIYLANVLASSITVGTEQDYLNSLLSRHMAYLEGIRKFNAGDGEAFPDIESPGHKFEFNPAPAVLWRSVRLKIIALVVKGAEKPETMGKTKGSKEKERDNEPDRKTRRRNTQEKEKERDDGRDKASDDDGLAKPRSKVRGKSPKEKSPKDGNLTKSEGKKLPTRRPADEPGALQKQSGLQEKIKYRISQDGNYFFAFPKKRESARDDPRPEKRPWWKSWSSTESGQKWDNLFADILRINGTSEFFQSFEADSYLVSANKRHGHPTATAILGLAQALDRQREVKPGNPATLFMTSAKSFPREGIEYLYRVLLKAEPPALLLGKNIIVRYLATETYMTLDTIPSSLHADGTRKIDLNNVTKVMDLNTRTTYETLAQQMESGLPILPITDSSTTLFELITTPPQGGEALYITEHFMTSGGEAFLHLAPEARIKTIQRFKLNFPYSKGDTSGENPKTTKVKMLLTGKYTYEVLATLQFHSTDLGKETWQLAFGPDNKEEVFRDDDPLPRAPRGFYFLEVAAPQDVVSSTMAIEPIHSLSMSDNYLARGEPNSPKVEVAHLIPLREYLRSLRDAPAGYTGKDVLCAMVREINYRNLKLSLPYELEILGYAVDLDNSDVNGTESNLFRHFTEATIKLVVPEKAKINLDDDTLLVSQASIHVEWGVDLTLKVEFHITANGDSVVYSKQVTNAMLKPTLTQVLESMGIHSSLRSQMRLPQLLGVLLRDQHKIRDLFANKMPTPFVTAGLALAKPLFDIPLVIIRNAPGGQILIDSLSICSDWEGEFSVAGMAFRIIFLNFDVHNNIHQGPRMQLQGAFELEAPTMKILLDLTYTLDGDEDFELYFGLLRKDQSLDDLSKGLPSTPSFNAMPVPMSKGLSLSGLASGMSFIGFTIQQSVGRVGGYSMTSISATVQFDDWKEYLPAGLVSKLLAGASTKIIIKNPLNSSERSLAVSVSFQIPIPGTTEPMRKLALDFVAQPLMATSEYEYRISAKVSDQGLSVVEAVDALGLDALSPDILEAIPAIGTSMLAHVFVKTISVGVNHKDKKWEAGDWLADLWIDSLDDVFPSEAISIYDISFSISRSGSVLVCSASGSVYLPRVQKVVAIDFKPPAKDFAGSFCMRAPDGLSIYDLLVSFELPDFDHVPIIKGLLDTELMSVDLDLALEEDTSWTTPSGRLEMRLANTFVGYLGLTEVTVSVFYRRPNKVLEEEAQILLDVEATMFDDAAKTFLRYDSLEGRLGVSVRALRPLPLSMAFTTFLPKVLSDYMNPIVGDLNLKTAILVLKTKAPYSINAFLLHLADDKVVAVEFLQLKSLLIEYRAGRQIPEIEQPVEVDQTAVDEEADGAEVSAESIAPRVDAMSGAQPTIPDKEETSQDIPQDISEPPPTKDIPSKLNLVGVVSKATTAAKVTVKFSGAAAGHDRTLSVILEPAKKGSLTVRGLISLLGITSETLPVEEPPNCPKLFDVSLEHVSGKLVAENDEVTQKSKLLLEKLKILAKSEGTVQAFDNPSVKLDNVRANLTYKRIKKDDGQRVSVLDGFIEGHVQICSVDIWVRYFRDPVKESSCFSGIATFDGTDTTKPPISLTDIGKAVGIPKDAWLVPTDLKVPQDLKVSVFGVCFIPGNCFEVSASGQDIWKGKFAGLELDIKEVKALFRRKTSLDPITKIAKPAYEAFLKGKLVFEGFVSAEAWLCLSKTKNSILTAVLTKALPDGNDLESITSKIASGEQSASWGALVPKSDSPIDFDQTGLFLHVDFKKSSFMLYGTIKDIGSALLIGRKKADSDKRDYIFLLEATDLGKLWSSTSADVMSKFDIERLSIQVISYDTTVNGLHRALELKDAEDAPGDIVDNGKLLEGEPPEVPETANIVEVSKSTTETLPGATEIKKGAWFFVSVALSKPQRPMTEAISFGMEPNLKARVTIYAAVASDPSARHYSVDVRNLVLLGGSIEVNGNGTYHPAKGLLDINANLTLKGLQKDDILFDINFKKSKNLTHFDMEASSTCLAEIKTPFESMFSVTLKSLKISGDITYSEEKKEPVSQYQLKGKAEIGRKKTMLSASVIFRKGKLAAAVLEYHPSDQVSIVGICSDIIQSDDTKPIVWKKSEYDDIELKSVTAAYLKDGLPLTVDKIQYSVGFSIAATLKLFEHDFLAMVKLDAARKGFTMEATYLGEIDLIFAKLGKTGDIAGPTVAIRAMEGEKTTYTVKSGFTLFQHPNFYLDLSYQPSGKPDDRCFLGKVGYIGEILGKTNPEFDFHYKHGRWGFSGWEMSKDMGDRLPLAKIIEKGSKTDTNCGEIIGLVWKTVVKTKFNFKLSLLNDDEHECSGDEIWVEMKWWYSITFLNTEIANLEINTMPLRFKGPFTLDALGTKLFDVILDEKNWEAMGKSLMGRPDDFGRLMAAVAFEKLAEKTVARILCRGRKYDTKYEVRTGARFITNKKMDNLKKSLDDTSTKATDSSASTTVDGAMSGISSALTSISSLAASIGGFLAADVAAKIMEGDDEEEKKQLEKDVADASENVAEIQRQVEVAKQRVRRALILGAAPVAKFVGGPDDEARINVGWESSLPNFKDDKGVAFDYHNFQDVTWEVAYSKTPGVDSSALQQTATKYEDTATDAEWTFTKVVYVSVRAKLTKNGVVLEAAEWKTTPLEHIPWLRPPIGFGFNVHADGDWFNFDVPPTLQDAGVYELSLADSESFTTGTSLYSTRIVKNTNAEMIRVRVEELGPDLKGHKTVQAYLRQVSSDKNAFHDSPWFIAPQSYTIEPALMSLQANMVQGRIVASWMQPGSSMGKDYEIRATREDGRWADLRDLVQSPGKENERNVDFDGLCFRHGETVTIAVQPKSPSGGTLSLVATATVIIHYPPMPRILTSTRNDVPSNTLTLVVQGNALIPKSTLLGLTLKTTLSSSSNISLEQVFDSVIGHSGWAIINFTQLLPHIDLRAGQVSEIQAYTKNETSSSALSDPWNMPSIPAGLELTGEFDLKMNLDGGIDVKWPAGKPGFTRVLRLELETDLTVYVTKEWRSDVDGPTLAKEEIKMIKAGMKVAVFRMTMTSKLTGYKERKWIVINQDKPMPPKADITDI